MEGIVAFATRGDPTLKDERWSIRPPPREDELLSSWIVRLARWHGMKVHTFCVKSFGSNVQVWNRDVDRHTGTHIVERLARGTGISVGRIEQTLLHGWKGLLSEQVTATGNSLGLLPLGITHRLRTCHGTQYCPLCLAEDDDEPYYRRVWRIAYLTTCARHKCCLSDACPQCDRPINFHRMEMGVRSHVGQRLAIFCYACGHDLRISPMNTCEEEVFQVVHQQDLAAQDALVRGWAELSDGSRIYPHLYFKGLRQLLFLSVAGRRTKSFHTMLVHRFGRPKGSSQNVSRPKCFENLRVTERFLASYYAARLLEEWPNRLVEFCRNSHVWSSVLFQGLDPVPYWLYKPVQEHLFVLHTPWRQKWNGRGASSYSKLGIQQLLEGPRTRIRRIKIANWVRRHPGLHSFPKLLAKGLRKAGLYSTASDHSQIARACRKYFMGESHDIKARALTKLEGSGGKKVRTARFRRGADLEERVLKILRAREDEFTKNEAVPKAKVELARKTERAKILLEEA